jgi:hypothetical protein
LTLPTSTCVAGGSSLSIPPLPARIALRASRSLATLAACVPEPHICLDIPVIYFASLVPRFSGLRLSPSPPERYPFCIFSLRSRLLVSLRSTTPRTLLS